MILNRHEAASVTNIINLDYASHTPAAQAVLETFCNTEALFPGNVMSAHKLGSAAHAEMEKAKDGIASLLGISPNEIIFTSGATEANNLAIKGITKAYEHVGKHILSTPLEHPSVSGVLSILAGKGYEVELLKIRPNGCVDLEHLKTVIRDDTVLICISAVDSELGVLQPVEEIAGIIENHKNCHLHVDAAQAMGKTAVKIPKNISTLCFSPHKFYGVCGIGVLIKRENIVLEPFIHGGKSTTIYRSGTPALSLAVSAYKALQIALAEECARARYVGGMRSRVVDYLRNYPHVYFNSPMENVSPYILNLSVVGVRGTDFQTALNDQGICVSVKSACSTDISPSRPVMALTGDKKRALSSWRISFSHLTTESEIDAFSETFDYCYKKLTNA